MATSPIVVAVYFILFFLFPIAGVNGLVVAALVLDAVLSTLPVRVLSVYSCIITTTRCNKQVHFILYEINKHV